MLTKLLSLIGTAKGAAVAAAVVTATTVTTGAVVVTNPDVQQSLQNVVQNVTGSRQSECAKATEEPEVVSLRNGADDKIRDAARKDQEELERLRSTQVDQSARQSLEDLVKDADDKLRDRATKALDDVAALTLGREGRLESASPSPVAGQGCDKAGPRASLAPDARGKIDAIVTAAIADMDRIANDAKARVAALPTRDTGKPSEPPGRPSGVPGGGPPGGAPAVRPSGLPGGFPGGAPGSGAPGGFPSGAPPVTRPSGSPAGFPFSTPAGRTPQPSPTR